MTFHVSPTIDAGGGMWTGGPWWNYPTPLGTPKSMIPYGCTYIVRYAPNGEAYEVPAANGIIWPWSEHKIKDSGDYGWCPNE